jgi:hypothetical protein
MPCQVIYSDLPRIEVCSHGNELLSHRTINQKKRITVSMTFDPFVLKLQYHFTQKVMQVLQELTAN